MDTKLECEEDAERTVACSWDMDMREYNGVMVVGEFVAPRDKQCHKKKGTKQAPNERFNEHGQLQAS